MPLPFFRLNRLKKILDVKSKLASAIITKFSKWLTREPPLTPSYLCDFDKLRFEIRPADVLLVEGRNRVSSMIKQITQSNWSHAMLYVGRLYDIDDPSLRLQIKKFYKGAADEQLVIESMMGQGTIVRPLSHYHGYHLRICRPLGLARDDAQKVIAYAVGRLGMRYSIRHIFDLARFLTPWGILPRRWRSSLFEHNALKPTEEICSSMIARAFKSVNFPILPEVVHEKDGYVFVSRDPRLFTPKDFDYSPFFGIVKYPILSLNEDTLYRQLSWKRELPSAKTETLTKDTTNEINNLTSLNEDEKNKLLTREPSLNQLTDKSRQ